MRGLIQLAIAETNTAFELSGIATQIRLVHAYRDLEFIEDTTPDAMSNALDSLRSKTDGVLDSVHAKRALYGADIVNMIVDCPGGCGSAYTGGYPSTSNMFSVSRHFCAAGYFSFAHEVGHLMNAGHDRGDRNQCERVDSATTDFNFGYRDPNSTFRSILATDCVLNQCDNLTQKGWPRVQRFSNPDLLYDGKAMGSRTENNARQINNVRATIAAFFPAMNCRSDFECNDKDPTTVDQCNLDNSACMFTPTSDPVLTSTAPLATTSVPAPFSNGLPTVFAAPSWAPVKESPKNLLTCILDRLRSVLRLFWSNDI